MFGKKKKDSDLDFDLDDITEIKPAEATAAIEKAVEVINQNAKPLTEEEERAAVIDRLKRYCGTQTICLPIVDSNGKLNLIIRNLYDATGDEFLQWLHLVYPLSRQGGFTAKDCDDYEYRNTTFKLVTSEKTLDYFKWPSSKLISGF